jgi:hypothetical protein
VNGERTHRIVTRGIELASPALDALLRVGERISRRAEPTDHEYYPVRSLASPDDDPVPGSTTPPSDPGPGDVGGAPTSLG